MEIEIKIVDFKVVPSDMFSRSNQFIPIVRAEYKKRLWWVHTKIFIKFNNNYHGFYFSPIADTNLLVE